MSLKAPKTVLIGVDDSATSVAAVSRVAATLAGSAPESRPTVLLVHVLEQALPMAIDVGEAALGWEAGGVPGIARGPTPEEFASMRAAAANRMERLAVILRDAGWLAESVKVEVVPGGYTRGAVAEILADRAKEHGADIVVVGRTRHGRLHEALLKSTGERIVHSTPGTTVWVVGTGVEEGEESAGE